jgi:hypothetical protein
LYFDDIREHCKIENIDLSKTTIGASLKIFPTRNDKKRTTGIGLEIETQNWKKMNVLDSLCLKEFQNKFFFGKFPENSWKIV